MKDYGILYEKIRRQCGYITVHSPYSAKSKLHEMQFCETCRRQNALKMHFVCIAKRVAVNGVNSNADM